MKKTLATLAALVLCAQTASAAFTLYDLARDSMYVARGEFIELERTAGGDRLHLRCDKMLKGDMAPGAEVILEAFEPAPADSALGRDVLVGFNLINGKYYFNLHPYAWRSFYFEESDPAPNGMNQNEECLTRFIDINRPHKATIESELRKRLELQTLEYEGQFSNELINEWKAELLAQMARPGTVAARDAAKAFIDHTLFRNTLTVEEMRYVGSLLKASNPGTLERSYMLEIVRNEASAHPSLAVMVGMLREETADYCVGKLSNLFSAVEDRAKVIGTVGAMAADSTESVQVRINALQTLAAMGDVSAVAFVQSALTGEMERGGDFNKNIVRGSLKALRRLSSESSTELLEAYIATEQCSASWELTRRAWIAYAMIDSNATNTKIRQVFDATPKTEVAKRKFFGRLLDINKINRELLMVFNED